MADELNRYGIEVLAWCLMTNHTHLIVVSNDTTVLSRAVGEAHRRYTRRRAIILGLVHGFISAWTAAMF